MKVGSVWHSEPCNHRGFDGVRYTDWQEACHDLRLKHRRAAALSEDLVQRAFARITETNRTAALRMQLTPFHVTDDDVTRNEKALHFSLTSSAERLAGQRPRADPLANGIEILAVLPPAPIPFADRSHGIPKENSPSTTATWSFDDE